jgi:monoamine oxidase
VLFVLLILLALIITAAVLSSQPYAEVPPLQFAKNSQSESTDQIVIIGAGAAGLYAGYTLKYLGVENFVILEASNRIGGRIGEMDDFIDVPLDLGAEWIHVNPQILKDLLLPFDDASGLENELPETISYHPQTYATVYGECCDWVRFFYRETKFRDTTWWGYFDKFIRSQIDLHIQLNALVETVEWGSTDTITVRLADGTAYVANQVLVAVPGAVLQNQDIVFDPPLPQQKVVALDKVWFAPGLKVWIEFEERFYTDLVIAGPFFDLLRYDKLYFDAVFRKPTDRNVLCLFEVGDKAEDHVNLSNEEILKSILEELDGIFDGKATQYYVQYHVQNWSKEPYIQAAYSYNYDDFWESIGVMQQPIDNRIYFAGEYLSEDQHISTVHGAALSGRRSVQQIIGDRQ